MQPKLNNIKIIPFGVSISFKNIAVKIETINGAKKKQHKYLQDQIFEENAQKKM